MPRVLHLDLDSDMVTDDCITISDLEYLGIEMILPFWHLLMRSKSALNPSSTAIPCRSLFAPHPPRSISSSTWASSWGQGPGRPGTLRCQLRCSRMSDEKWTEMSWLLISVRNGAHFPTEVMFVLRRYLVKKPDSPDGMDMD